MRRTLTLLFLVAGCSSAEFTVAGDGGPEDTGSASESSSESGSASDTADDTATPIVEDTGASSDSAAPSDSVSPSDSAVPPADSATDEVIVVKDSGPIATDTGCTPGPLVDVEFAGTAGDTALVSRARQVALQWRAKRTGALTRIAITAARQVYDCPEDYLSSICRSHDAVCTSCSTDGEGTCTCLVGTAAEGKLYAKLYKGTPGGGTLLTSATIPTTAIATAPATSLISFALSASLAAGVDYYVELSTDGSGAQIALRGDAAPVPPYAMFSRQTFTAGPWVPFATPRAAFKVDTVACP